MRSLNRYIQYHRRWRRTVGIGAIVGLTLLLALPVAGQGQGAIVRIDPVMVEVAAGQTATVKFVLADAQNAYGINVRASFDPQVVEVVDADPGKDGVQLSPGDFFGRISWRATWPITRRARCATQ